VFVYFAPKSTNVISAQVGLYALHVYLDSTLTQPIHSVFPVSFRVLNARSFQQIVPNALCLNFTTLIYLLVEAANCATSLLRIVFAAMLMERHAKNVSQKFHILKREDVLTAALLVDNASPALDVCLVLTAQLYW
jgi:hypothetical protein